MSDNDLLFHRYPYSKYMLSYDLSALSISPRNYCYTQSCIQADESGFVYTIFAYTYEYMVSLV